LAEVNVDLAVAILAGLVAVESLVIGFFIVPRLRGIESEESRTRLAAIVQHSEDAILAKNDTGLITAWNAAATRLYGYTAAEAIGRHVSLIVPPHRAGEESEILDRILAGDMLRDYETERLRKDGTIAEVSLSVSPIYGRGPEPVGASVIARDVSDRLRATRKSALLNEAGPQLAASLDVGATAQALARIVVPGLGRACVVDVLSGEGALERLSVMHVDPVVERAIWDEYHRAGRRQSSIVRSVLDSMTLHLSTALDGLEELSISEEDRTLIRQGGIESFAIIPLVARGRAIGVVSVGFGNPYPSDAVDILGELCDRAASGLENARLYHEAETARAAAEHAGAELEREQIRFRVAFQQAPFGLALVSMAPDALGRFIQVNPALSRLTGYSQEELLARTFMALTHPEDREIDAGALERIASGEASELFIEKRYLHANGHPIWVHVHTSLVRSREGEPLYCVSHFQDVTEQKRYDGQLQYLADHDALTGVFNRRRLEEELERVWNYVARYDEPASLLVVDLDNFKYINDTYGHAIGDDVIARASAVLQRQSRTSDTVARLGGDEFAIILPHTDIAGAETHARHLLAELRARPLTTAVEPPLYVTASIGIAAISAASNLTGPELLVEADVAMYDAKEAGRDRICHVDMTADRSGRLRSRLSWSQRIREALDFDGFELWEQPIVTVATGVTERYEILLRMRGDDGEAIPPGVFLYIAEHFGQIQAIDRWVIDRSIRLLGERRAAGEDAHIAVNVSGATISDADVIEFIVERVRTAPIDPTRLTFEVTETTAIVNIERAREFARRLAGLGCKFALDDFGAGFGSFFYLKQLPFDVVKIDGDFIRKLPESTTDQLTVQAIVQIARGLGKQTVAEFVGDDATMDLLRGYGVDYAQGYHLGKPQPVVPPASRLAVRS
jgi:diguanylate cyclase (GGDEF)-like protein/PAS domain S-box-containing protein